MSIFGDIMGKIFHAATHALEAQATPAAAPSAAPTADPVAPSIPAQPGTAPSPGAPAASSPGASSAAEPVDVEAVLTQMAGQKGGGGNWQSSIVDLLKLLDLDSSLAARKQLADELAVHDGADGTAEENIALHKAVMQKLAENGGKVPASLLGH